MKIKINLGYRHMARAVGDASTDELIVYANIFRKLPGPIAEGARLYAEERAARQKVAEASELAKRVMMAQVYRAKTKILQRNFYEGV